MRKVVDALDVFRVITDDGHLTAKSSHGGVLSAACAAIVTLLLVSECYEFFRPGDFRSSMVVARREMGRSEAVNFNVTFLQFPCGCMRMEAYQATAGLRLTKQEDTLVWQRERMLLNSNVMPLGLYEQDMGLERTLGEGCRVSGRFLIDKVPSNFVLSCNLHTLQSGPPPTDMIINDLWFGDKRLPQNEIADKLANLLAGEERRGDPQRTVYQYFLSIVPTVVEDGVDARHVGYQYTATSSVVQAYVPPGLYFAHLHSPIAVELRRTGDTWSHFLVNIASISGGVYTVSELAVAAIDWVKQYQAARSGGG